MKEHSGSWEDGERAVRYNRQTRIGVRLMYAPLARRIEQRVAVLEEGAVIVDVGTGPGLLAIEMHKIWPRSRVIGVDPSGEMLRIASENASRAGVSGFEARLGTAEEIPLEANSVDLVVSQSSFHEWDDQQKGLTEALRVLKPGRSLILKDYNLAWLSPWKRKLLGLFHHLDMFRFTLEQVSVLLRDAGFNGIEGDDKGLQWFLRAEKP